MPFGSCNSAMASTVAETSAPVSTPLTSGTRTADLLCSGCPLDVDLTRASVDRFRRVDHQALAQHRVQHLFGDTGDSRTLLDVPHEETVVELHQRELVVRRAD